ncbi:MAG: hypothetical protein K1X64_23165 [Myxococcaceae bacterium]|nr:hypothetical protein [Myxococcaceae bacterium]
MKTQPQRPLRTQVWWFAFGYFGTYVPYAALTKLMTSGHAPSGAAYSGARLLPWSVTASLVTSALFLVISGWWRAAHRCGRHRWPCPTRATTLSALCASATILTTTLGYSFEGTSVLLTMLFMRGGVLIIAPLVDAVHRRAIRNTSWGALALSALGVLAATGVATRLDMGMWAWLNLAVYLTSYFVRLHVMSGHAKNDDRQQTKAFFVEEQLVATPALLLALGAWSAFGVSSSAADMRTGWVWPSGLDGLAVIAIGVFSQGTGIFGALVLLYPSENSYSVPINRASSLVAGVAVSALLAAAGLGKTLSPGELWGAGWVLLAMAVLAFRRDEPAPQRSLAPQRRA